MEKFVEGLKINIPDDVRQHGMNVSKTVMKSMGNSDYLTSLDNYFNVDGCINRLLRIERRLKIDLTKMRILEVGTGIGMFTVVSRKLGLDITGIEPGGGSYNKNRQAIDALLHANGLPLSTIIEGEGENCTNFFDDNSFDLIVSFSVLEHVRDPKKVINEISKLLKPGGLLYLTCSNHRSFYEGHYGIIWLPFLTKATAPMYVRFWRKNDHFLNELYLIKPKAIRKWINEAGLNLHSIFESDFHLLKDHDSVNSSLGITPVLSSGVGAVKTRMTSSAKFFKSIIKSLRLVWVVDRLHLRPILYILAQKPR